MTQKKNYSRYFIILQEDEKGYSEASDKISSGYAKIEMKNDKCKVSFYVQNLKRDSIPYYMILICTKKDEKKLINIGELNIDENGRADISYEYTVDNIGDTGISMDKVSGAAIIKLIDKNLISVMNGFSSTDIPDWKSCEVLKREKTVNVNESRSEKKSIFDKYEESIEKTKQSEPEKNVKSQDNLKNINNTIVESKQDEINSENQEERQFVKEENEGKDIEREKLENIERLKDIEREELENIERKKDIEREKLKDMPTGTIGDFFKSLANGYEEIADVCDDVKKCRWFKVPVASSLDMTDTSNYNKYTVIYYPMMNYYPYIKKYGHFLFGYKCDPLGNMKYLVYAIPGTKSKQEQPFEGKSGFVTFEAQKNGEDKEDNFGYWIMFYDFRTSTIVIPVK